MSISSEIWFQFSWLPKIFGKFFKIFQVSKLFNDQNYFIYKCIIYFSNRSLTKFFHHLSLLLFIFELKFSTILNIQFIIILNLSELKLLFKFTIQISIRLFLYQMLETLISKIKHQLLYNLDLWFSYISTINLLDPIHEMVNKQ